MGVPLGRWHSASATAVTTTTGTPTQTCRDANGSTLRSRIFFGAPRRACRNMTVPTTLMAVTAGTCWYTIIGASGKASSMMMSTAKPTAQARSDPITPRRQVRPTATAVPIAATSRFAAPAANDVPPSNTTTM
ncbi:hypothetical protein BN1047_04772 [Mycolicibacterium neoaurum]|uniref:Uncharacterized protein n=2 Tax=Mycolicibacterium neoaurum TaxID=1795 RepID=A0AAV2WSG7_MYCNE|nr:hypothetical protein BN1047_04772 [Mycolicibacterium neoaurum]